MDNKRDVLLIIFVGILAIAVPFVAYWYTRVSPQRSTSNAPLIPAPTAPDLAVSEEKVADDGSVAKGSFETGRYYLSVEGTISDEPIRSGDTVQFHFVIESTADRRVANVVLKQRVPEGISVGVYQDSFAGLVRAEVRTIDEVTTLLSPGQKIQLRFMYYPDITLPSEEQAGKDALERMLDGKTVEWEGISMFPSGIGVVQ